MPGVFVWNWIIAGFETRKKAQADRVTEYATQPRACRRVFRETVTEKTEKQRNSIFRETVWEIFFKLSYFVSKGDLHSLQVIRMLATLG